MWVSMRFALLAVYVNIQNLKVCKKSDALHENDSLVVHTWRKTGVEDADETF
jgi:hypothetical protein